MKKIIFIFSFLILISFTATILKAQDQDAMKKWMEYMTPGEQHIAMAKMAGDWKYTSKMWMAPGQEPMTTEGKAKFEVLLGGRYVQMNVNGSIMGMPFEGIGVNGYDNASKKYVSSWIDNMGTSIMFLEGTMDPATNVLTYTGTMVDPMTGKNLQIRQTIKGETADKFIMEMYDTKEGVENKSMEIVYTR